MTQAILADTFPPEKRGLAFALYGVTAICAPALAVFAVINGPYCDSAPGRIITTSAVG